MTELFDFADRDQDGALNFEEYLINAFDYMEPENEWTPPETEDLPPDSISKEF